MGKKVVVVGGGTGNFTILQGLKESGHTLSAIVSMADDGGSTGILRDELGVLPPGDVRQCLVALSHSSDLMRSLMSYRFDTGGLGGHSFGNLLLSALEKVTGSFEKAVDEMGRILAISGRVIPVTTHHVRLYMVLKDHTVLHGEREVYLSQSIDDGYTSLYLDPHPRANPKALQELAEADLIVVGPGGLYTSLIPNFLVEGVSEAFRKSKAKKVFVVNLMNKRGQTTNFTAGDYVREISRYIGEDVFDHILVNGAKPSASAMEIYAAEGELVQNDLRGERVVETNLLGEFQAKVHGDIMQRSFIRHCSTKLREELLKIATTI